MFKHIPQIIAGLEAIQAPHPTPAQVNPFLQAMMVVFGDTPFTAEDFSDINAQDKNNGITILHLAVILNHTHLAKQLLHCGANPHIKNHAGQSALTLSHLIENTEITKTLVQYVLQDHPEILKHSDFTLYKAKHDGITTGGFYRDAEDTGWLLKEGHYHHPDSVVNEYVAGGLYQLFLGENAPQTEIVVHDSNASLLIGSKLLSNFTTLSDMFWGASDQNAFHDYSNPYGNDFPMSINGKPITHLFDGLSAIHFLADTDAHFGNVGLIEHDDHYAFAKIDHGFSFGFNHVSSSFSLDDLRSVVKWQYQLDSLEKAGYDAVYQSITNISNLDFSIIAQVVSDKMHHVHNHMDVLGFTDTLQDLDHHAENLLSHLKTRHENYQKVANFMSLEKGIIDHDFAKVSDLVLKGVSLDEGFKPFFNPVSASEYSYWDTTTKSVTGSELATKNWPELLDLLGVNSAQQNITLGDVLHHDDAISFTQVHAPQITPPLHVPIELHVEHIPHFEMFN